MGFKAIKSFFKFEKDLKQVAIVNEETLWEMGENLTTVADISKKMAITSQEAASALHTLSAAGISGEQAGKAIREQFKQMLCKHDAEVHFQQEEEAWWKICSECWKHEPASALEALACAYQARKNV